MLYLQCPGAQRRANPILLTGVPFGPHRIRLSKGNPSIDAHPWNEILRLADLSHALKLARAVPTYRGGVGLLGQAVCQVDGRLDCLVQAEPML